MRRNLGFYDWLLVDTRFASYALAFEGNRIVGGAPYGMKVIGSERRLDRVWARLERMGARLSVSPAPAWRAKP